MMHRTKKETERPLSRTCGATPGASRCVAARPGGRRPGPGMHDSTALQLQGSSCGAAHLQACDDVGHPHLVVGQAAQGEEGARDAGEPAEEVGDDGGGVAAQQRQRRGWQGEGGGGRRRAHGQQQQTRRLDATLLLACLLLRPPPAPFKLAPSHPAHLRTGSSRPGRGSPGSKDPTQTRRGPP